jgi:hypothetical protein
MAIAAIDTNGAYVMGMTERHGLFTGLRGACRPSGPVEGHSRPTDKTQETDDGGNAYPRSRIRTVMEDLGHDITYVPTQWSEFYYVACRNESNPLPTYPTPRAFSSFRSRFQQPIFKRSLIVNEPNPDSHLFCERFPKTMVSA